MGKILTANQISTKSDSTCAAIARPNTPLESSLKSLQSSIIELREEVGSLATRLNCVCSPRGPMPPNSAGAPESSITLIAELNSAESEIRSISDEVSSLLSRLCT